MILKFQFSFNFKVGESKMIKASFLDFYITVVHEDGEIIKKITDIIYNTGIVENKSEIASFWWNDFQKIWC